MIKAERMETMFNKQNFCHVASNNRNEQKAGLFVYKTTDDLATVATSGYFNEKIIDINLHDLIIHEWHDPADRTKVQRNILCVVERTLENVGTIVIKSKWEGDIEQTIAQIQQYIEDTFVKKDGSSVMTGALKFSAGSMRGAIAGGFNGLTFFKMDSEGNLTQIASLSDTQFIPATDNTLDIGTNVRKIERIYVGKLNNGHDIDVPVTNSEDTLALKSDVDLAANSGRMITDQGVWYAKMYAGTTAPSAENGTNYADFSQVDGGNNPIIVIYERQSGAWVQTQTITPPAEYDGYVPITSKIWDIPEQAGQQGGRILWNHQSKEFTPYPQIVSFDNISVTGDSTVAMPVNSSPQQIVNKDYVDNNANPLKYATNCITEIPQKINLELSSGTLTLKAGSKIYVPDGFEQDGVTKRFVEQTIVNDLTLTAKWGTAEQVAIGINSNGTALVRAGLDRLSSGSTAPIQTNYRWWYDTTNNFVKEYNGGAYTDVLSFPIAIVTVPGDSTATVNSIDQVFNGFGYIGSTVFALPGVKTLAPNGRNADGTLSNIEIQTPNVITNTSIAQNTSLNAFLYNNSGTITWFFSNNTEYNNTNNYNQTNSYIWEKTSLIGTITLGANGVISDFNPKQTFHAVDYNEADFVIAFQRPTFANDYTWYRKYKSGWVEQGGIGDASTTGEAVTFPIVMDSTYYVHQVTNAGPQYGTTGFCAGDHTTTGMKLYCSYAQGRNAYWEIKGKAAS